jgi:hypothetical protein
MTAEDRAMAAMKNTDFIYVFCRSLDAQTLTPIDLPSDSHEFVMIIHSSGEPVMLY